MAARSEISALSACRRQITSKTAQVFSDHDGFAAATKFAVCSDAGSFDLSKTLHALDFAATAKHAPISSPRSLTIRLYSNTNSEDFDSDLSRFHDSKASY